MPVVEWCVSEAKDLRFIGREFQKRGEELRNDRSANLSLVETGGRKRQRYSGGEIESVSDATKIANMVMTGAGNG